MKKHSFKRIKNRLVFRVLPFILAFLMLLTSAPVAVFSTDEKTGESAAAGDIIYDYDTLKVTLDGEEISSMSIYPYEKIEISGTGIPENATYQWQIKHPEKNNLWVNIYDAKSDTIGVSAALINNMLAEDGTAKLRLRAYTDDYAYLSNPVTVTLLDENQIVSEHAMRATYNGNVMMASNTSELASVEIHYIKYEYVEQVDDKGIKTYVLQEKGEAYGAYVATIRKGSDLSINVPNPIIVGYNATLVLQDGQTGAVQQGDTINITLTNVTENVSFRVEYRPAMVNYNVHYYFQNIYDDLYVENNTLAPSVTMQGYTGDMPDANVTRKEFDGFTSLFYEPDIIAADGSTVFNVYYERDYYLMEFDCAGGYGTDTVYVRYGTYIAIADPVRPGYVFAGWDLVKTGDPDNAEPMGTQELDPNGDPTGFYTGDGHANIIASTMPYYNTAYKALWERTETTYTVVYWRENADDNGYSYWGSAQYDAISASEVSGTNHQTLPNVAPFNTESDYFTYNEVKTIAEENARTDLVGGKVIVEGDGSTIVNVYYSRNVYRIVLTDSSVSSCQVEEHTHDDSCKVIVCSYTHVHGPECVKGSLSCGLEAHEHTDCTLSCTHVHDSNCCAKEHTHNIVCYEPTLNQYHEATDDDRGFENYISTITSPKQGYVYRYRRNSTDTYYFYDGAKWYYLGNSSLGLTFSTTGQSQVNNRVTVSGAQTSLKCGLDEHTHTDGTCNYSACTHTHDDACYTCGNVSHAHTDTCYEWSCGEDSHVHHAGCYAIDCGKAEHKHSEDSSYSRKIVKIIEAKYGAYIGDEWTFTTKDGYSYPENAGAASWYPVDSDIYDQRLALIDIMPGETIEFYDYPQNNNKRYYNYYVECLPGETADITYENVNYKHYLKDGTLTVDFNIYTAAEDFFEIAGFTKYALTYNGTRQNNINANISNMSNGAILNFYYKRTEYKFKYFNYNDYLSDNPNNDTNVKYQTPLSDFEITKAYMGANHYPDKLEPGAYEFGGWYTTPECFPGTEVDWETITMPDGDLTLYAKWTPVKRNVYFHLTYGDMQNNVTWTPVDQNGNVVPTTYPIVVDHGQVLGTTYNYTPTRSEDYDNDGEADYVFIGWFYMDEDNKKRFAPDTMEIKRDLHLFAEWQSKVDTKYEVEYVLDADATISGKAYTADTPIALMTEGHSTAGRTKTFIAKAGEQLLDEFKNAPLFPLTNTHSILMDADPTGNTYTFRYVVDDTVYYKVRYVDKVTGAVLDETGDLESHNAIVTEKFKNIDGYVPEQFYIRKILAADGNSTTAIAENVITFYYLPNTSNESLYNVEYYKWNQLTGAYEQVQSEPGRATVNETVTINVDSNKFTGFTFKKWDILSYTSESVFTTKSGTTTPSTLSETLSEYGLVFKLYYDPIPYPYRIQFVDRDTNEVLGYGKLTDSDVHTLDSIKDEKANFDAKLTYTAPGSIITSDNKIYNLIAGSEQTKTLTIRIEQNATDASNCDVNILTFYYMKEVIPIEYHAVCTIPGFEGGSVSQSFEPIPQSPQGCDALNFSGFTFEGWYFDEACTLKVPDVWLSDPILTDGIDEKSYIKPPISEVEKGEDGKEHYYALFKPIISELEITKDTDNTTCDDTFVFHIVGEQGTITENVDMYVSVTGNSSVVIKELYCGNYTITELTGWSWKYDVAEGDTSVKTIVLTANPDEVTFTNTDNNSNWLSGETVNENQFDVND